MAAKPYTTILLLAFLLLLSSTSSARLLNDNNIPQGLAALDPESNLVLPVIINDGRRVLPCDMGKEEEVSTSTRKSQVLRMTPRLARKYRPVGSEYASKRASSTVWTKQRNQQLEQLEDQLLILINVPISLFFYLFYFLFF
ncbi:hypothetical protein O6P43_020109 [Quillaja saponaria]|uniref:Uncharacterized protein n=1 Tax=Quillaja saponaria TaxID=32244 RepID=A0AAD7PLI4_QUISA|nr:hypothetical protein O6P43_020109 [Quillaja saponaria]